MANFYLELARTVLRSHPEPLSASEIYGFAKSQNLIPPAYGRAKTPHKTIHARLAESIRRDGSRSPFYRFAAGRFGLRENLSDLEYRSTFNREYKAPIRKKEISNEIVLCLPRNRIDIDMIDGFFSLDNFFKSVAGNEWLTYVPRKKAEKDPSYKQLVTYIAVVKDRRVLCYERGTYYAADKSIGFGGHVSQSDYDLFFLEDELGIFANAVRELSEELSLAVEVQSLRKKIHIVGVINDNSTDAGQRHIAIAMIYMCDAIEDPGRGELEVRNLHWMSPTSFNNELPKFEIWSQIFLKQIGPMIERFSNR